VAINYSIDAEAQIVRLTYVREPTIEELWATLRAIFRAADYRPGFGFLVDRRSVAPPTREFVERVLAFMTLQREALAGGRWAVVVGEMTSYGMGRMGALMSEARHAPMPVRPFLDIAEAEAWLRESAPAP
jgi:hypothetical protein